MQSVLDVLKKTEAHFARIGFNQPKVEAEWIIAAGLNCKRLEIYLQHERMLTEEELAVLREYVKRRTKREPLRYIEGKTEFYGLPLKIRSGALIPRPETEVFVEEILKRMPEGRSLRVVDLGTGSGAIAIAIAANRPQARVLGIDLSTEALTLARENIESLDLGERVKLKQNSWLEGFDRTADWIIANPPYLSSEEWSTAEEDVRVYEPREALVSGNEGRADLEEIMKSAWTCLESGGNVALETGIQHHEHLEKLAREIGYEGIESLEDQRQRERFFFVKRPADAGVE